MIGTGPGLLAAEGPPRELVARFKEALDRLWPRGGKLGLAVSGGPDSLAMLLLAEAAIPGEFEVGTVDHGLRPEAASECAMVAEVCAVRGISCEVLRATVEVGNTQAMARRARYGMLADWADRRGLSAVATAHHADDQAETLLMRLNRGSGVAGLAGVRETGSMPRCSIRLIRPLLAVRRSELATVVFASGLDPVQDPSNADDSFERARMRKAMADADWLEPLALTTAAANLADAEEALQWAAAQAWCERVKTSANDLRYRPGLPHEITMRIVIRAIASFGTMPRGKDVARLIKRLEAGESSTLGSAQINVDGGDWVFRPEPPRRTS